MGKEAKKNLTVRKMAASDLKAVRQIEQESFRELWTCETWLAEINAALATYFVLERKKAIIGFAGYWLVAGEAQVIRIAVKTNERGKGLGRFIADAMVRSAWQEDAEAVTLEVRKSNAPAIRTYERVGFSAAGVRPRYYDDGEDAVIMWLYRQRTGESDG
ncbi:MAG: ribosomal protein S18-alanine N-acetyltransferase [Acholeplasmataceae bacterium]|nr:ribosomal protein S18-alanine N-acetyltransferase [Acidaminococcaceae bacterium]NLY83425.1 ribosomal protein S18-alanine N-acetyltransferase [Acholeplasmataceae bacterium]